MSWETILKFWFEEISSKQWWVKDPTFDETIRQRFGKVHSEAARGELYQWREAAQGRLAEIIVLDQFSRNMFRDTAQAFAYDPIALVLAQEALHVEAEKELEPKTRSFLVMPFMHSESAKIHKQAMIIFSQPGMDGSLDYEQKHKAIIDRFGRYPHRNQILGRESTPEEIAFLKGPGSSF